MSSTLITFGAAPVFAQSMTPSTALPDMSERPFPMASQFAIAGETGYGRIDEDYFINLETLLYYAMPAPQIGCPDDATCPTRLQLGAQLPLRFRVIDNIPEQNSVVRTEDWSTISDYLRIIRFIEYGYLHETIHGRLGEIGAATLGHGTILNNYYNVITPDHYQLGLQGSFNTVYGGMELLINNIVRPTILGTRGYIRPWAFVDSDHWLHGLAFGASVVADIGAPTQLKETQSGTVVVGSDAHPAVANSAPTSIVGIDLEYDLISTSTFNLTPYTDFNHHVQLGSGLHSGLLAHYWPTEQLGFFTRLEYRLLGSQYMADYIGPIYEIERYHFVGWEHQIPTPKLRATRSQNESQTSGFYGSTTMHLTDILSTTIAYSDYQGPNNQSLRLRASLHPNQLFQLGIFYYKQNFDNLSEVFDLNGSMVVTEARLPITDYLYLKGHYSRLWRLNDIGEYTPVGDWNISVGSAFSF